MKGALFMTPEQLGCFLAAARENTFLEAAESLHITQSTLSKQIQKLEQELGLALWDRSRRRAVLTPAGEYFLPLAERLFQQHQETRRLMERFRRESAREIQVGALPILTQYEISPQLHRFRGAHPEYVLLLTEAEEQELLEGLHTGRFAVIFTRQATTDPVRHGFLPLTSDRLVAVLPEGHPLAQRDSLRLKDVAGENLLLMPPHTYLHKLCLSLFAQAGETPRVAGASRMESLLSQVRAGEGISFFAQANFRLFQTQGLRAVPLEESPSLAVGIAWNKEEKLSPGVQMLLAFFQASS